MSNPHSFKPLIPPPGGADDVDLLDEVANNPGLVMLALTPPVAFNPIFVDMTGSITAGLFLLHVFAGDGGWPRQRWR